MGDTVIMGVPNYVRTYTDRAQNAVSEPSVHETGLAPIVATTTNSRTENPPSPPPFTLPALSANLFTSLPVPLDTADNTSDNPAPMQTAFAPTDVAAAQMTTTALAATPNLTPTTPTTPITPAAPIAKPNPLPKPGSTLTPGASASLQAPAAPTSPTITNAPRIGGEAVRQALAADQRNSASATVTGTASAAELEAVDAMLADPINKQLIDLAKQQFGPTDAKSWVAEAQVKLYGEARFQEMTYLHRALPMVQNAYAQAVTAAYLANGQPALTANLSNNQGITTPPSTFDINAFNKEYESRTDLMAQAFAAKFGGVPVTQETGFSGTVSGGDSGADASGAYVPVFNVGGLFTFSIVAEFPSGPSEGGGLAPPPNYSTSAVSPGRFGAVLALGPDIGDHRAMYDDTAVWFDPSMGFITHAENFKPDKDSNFDRVVEIVGQVAFVAAAVYTGSVYLLGPEGAAVLGFSANSWQAGAIRGAVQAGIGTIASSAYTGRTLTLADFGRSIFTGGVMGGLVNYAGLNTYGITTQNGAQVINWGERLTAIVGRGAIQGILQQVTGGRFQDGLRNGLASSLSNELSRTLGAEINRWASENNIDPYIVSQLRMVAQGFSSALVQTATNGGQAGLEAFLNDLISGQIGAAGEAERAEINQLTAQYGVAVATNDYTTQATILNDLTERWMNNHPGDTRAQALAQVAAGLNLPVDAVRLTQEGNGRVTAIGANTLTATFDDDGNLLPDVIDTTKPIGNQARQIEARLVQQGFSARDAGLIAEGWLVNRIADSIQAKEPTTSRQDALSQARAMFNDPNPIVIDVTTRARVPGQEFADQFLGALVGTGGVAVDVLKGTVDLLAMSADGFSQIANVLTGGDLFPDAARRNEARSEILNQLASNWDKLPGAMVDQFNAQLEEANRLDAQDTSVSRLEAARIRSHVFGGAALAVLTLGETAVATGPRVISSLADARAALGEIVSSGPLRGSLAAQSGAVDIAAMLDGGRMLVRVGAEIFEAEFRAVAEGTGRQLVLLRPVTDLLDDAARLQLRYGPESMTPENLARINRAIDALTPQRFQQLTERYAELVNSNKPWSWKNDFDIALAESQQSAIRRAAIEAGLLPDVPYIAGTAFRDFNAIPGLVRNVEKLPESMWRLSDPEQFAYLDRLIGGRPPGYTWHHSHEAGRMELISYGIHRVYPHEGARAPGQWAYRPQGR